MNYQTPAKTEPSGQNKINAYRAIEADLIEKYKTEPDQIPNIEGTHFVSLNSTNKYNNCSYSEQNKYLHFFPSAEMAENYAKTLAKALSKDIVVAGFYFPEEVLQNFTFTGHYELERGGGFEQEEYIIPLELYDPNLSFVKELKKFEKPVYDPDSYSYGFF